MKSPLKPFIPALTRTVLVGCLVATFALQGCKPSMDRTLEAAAAEMNKRAPMMADKETRLDKATAAPNKTLVYHYTLINLRSADIQKDKFVTQLRPGIIAQYKTNPQMKALRDNGVTLEYRYADKAGVEVASFAVSPKDF